VPLINESLKDPSLEDKPEGKPTLAIDFDGVIGRPLLGLNVRIGSGEWPESKLTRWPGHQSSFLDSAIAAAKSALAPLRYSGRSPMQDVDSGLASLVERWRLVIVTARPASMQGPTWRWLNQNGLVNFISDVYTNDTGAPTPIYKLQTAQKISAIGFVEDDGRTARYLSVNGINTVFLVDWPRNRGIYPPNVKVVRNLIEVNDHLEGLRQH
jgi:hypothetical protein